MDRTGAVYPDQELTHPPVPPGPHWKRQGSLFIVPKSRPEHTWICIGMEDPPTPWKPIIAAVARCGWVDEAVQQTEFFLQAGSSRQEYADRCIHMAEAWACWERRA